MANNITGGGQSTQGTSSAGQSWISTLVARMPYTYKVIQNAYEANPKYDLFNGLITQKDERLQKQSIYQNQDEFQEIGRAHV